MLERDRERALLSASLDRDDASRRTRLLLVGQPGVGKTSLMEYCADQAERAGWRVLRARGVEGETYLSFACLAELLHPFLFQADLSMDGRYRALRSFVEGGADTIDVLAVGVAVADILKNEAALQPLLLVIDDTHWADDSSLRALALAARWLSGDITIVAAAREVPRMLHDWTVMHVHGLGREAALCLLLEPERATVVARSVAEQLVERTAGNPLALIELPKMLSSTELSGQDPLPDLLPLGPLGTVSLVHSWDKCRNQLGLP